MVIKNKVLFAFISISLVLSIPLTVHATVPVSTGFEGPKGIITVVMHYEDVSNIDRIQAVLEQDLIALEYAFNRLQQEGKLDPRFPRLVISASKHYNIDNRFEIWPTELSFTNSATFASTHPAGDQFEPRHLGPAYFISTSVALLRYRDIAAMLLLLNRLDDQNPIITISDEQTLNQAKALPGYIELLNLTAQDSADQTSSGGFTVAASWESEVLHYYVIDETGSVVADLMPFQIYVGKPAWPPAERKELQGRILAYAAPELAVVYDLVENKYHLLNLNFTFEDIRTQDTFRMFGRVQRVEFAMHSTENKLFVIPLGGRLNLNAIYSLNLDTGEWVRELEGEFLFHYVDTNIRNRVWLNFLPATPDRRTKNVALRVKQWTAGEPVPVDDIDIERTAEPTGVITGCTQALWLLLPVIAAAAIIILMLFIRYKWRRA